MKIKNMTFWLTVWAYHVISGVCLGQCIDGLCISFHCEIVICKI